jgi:hypothetical protein
MIEEENRSFISKKVYFLLSSRKENETIIDISGCSESINVFNETRGGKSSSKIFISA